MPNNYTQDAAFCAAIALVIGAEGNFVDDPHDPGGPTKYGISWNYNQEYLAPMGITRDRMCDLTLEQAKQIYYQKYWLGSGSAGITDPALAYEHLDCAVNTGISEARHILDSLSHNPRHWDGSNGKNRTLFLRLLLEYTAARLYFYGHCRNRDRYLSGWVNRMAAVIQNSLGLE